MPVVPGEGGLPKVCRRPLPHKGVVTATSLTGSAVLFWSWVVCTCVVDLQCTCRRIHSCLLLPRQVVLSTGEASAELYLHGATLTSWKIGGEELIFVSPKVHEPGVFGLLLF